MLIHFILHTLVRCTIGGNLKFLRTLRVLLLILNLNILRNFDYVLISYVLYRYLLFILRKYVGLLRGSAKYWWARTFTALVDMTCTTYDLDWSYTYYSSAVRLLVIHVIRMRSKQMWGEKDVTIFSAYYDWHSRGALAASRPKIHKRPASTTLSLIHTLFYHKEERLSFINAKTFISTVFKCSTIIAVRNL